ncbi:hypothetical protein BGW80DRAFT_1450352 [Lactifluus volemus]|nr:hypothetical protein BGW80DRAFT_1450352 [Lactifluus volemus]
MSITLKLGRVLLIPLSWILTLWTYPISTIWFIFTLPMRAFLYFYEQIIRAKFPRLPSIQARIQRFQLWVSRVFNPLTVVLSRVRHGGQNPTNLPSLNVDIQ